MLAQKWIVAVLDYVFFQPILSKKQISYIVFSGNYVVICHSIISNYGVLNKMNRYFWGRYEIKLPFNVECIDKESWDCIENWYKFWWFDYIEHNQT